LSSLDFANRLFISFLIATVSSVIISIVILFLLSSIIYFLGLNYYRDNYWVLNVSLYCFLFFWIIIFSYFSSSNKEKTLFTNKKEISDHIEYLSNKATGTVEAIHVGGRTEVTPVVQVELTRYFHEENLWVLGGGTPNSGIIQPAGRKNYFIPVLSGKLHIKYGAAQLMEVERLGYENEDWNEFRVANIAFKDSEPISVLFKHYKYKDGKWSEIAGYEANFDGQGARTPDDPSIKKENKVFEHPLFTEHSKSCKQCGGGAISEEGGPAPLCAEGFKLLQQDATNNLDGIK